MPPSIRQGFEKGICNGLSKINIRKQISNFHCVKLFRRFNLVWPIKLGLSLKGVNGLTLQELEQLKQQTLKQMQLNGEATMPRVTVGMGSCGVKAGAQEVYDTISQELKAVGVEAVLVPVGCMGLCAEEPVVQVKLPNMPVITYSKVDPAKALRIVDQHILDCRPVRQWVFAVGDNT